LKAVHNLRKRAKIEEDDDEDSMDGYKTDIKDITVGVKGKGKRKQLNATSRKPTYHKAKRVLDNNEVSSQGIIDKCIKENGGTLHPKLNLEVEAMIS